MLNTIAGWAAQIKRHYLQPSDAPDPTAFLHEIQNTNNPFWHYIALPVNATVYNRTLSTEFTNDDDIR